MNQIIIIPTTGANFTSLQQSLLRLNIKYELSINPTVIAKASHVILPGVGHAAYAMTALKETGLDQVIRQLTQPVLGICLGMQLLTEYCSEGQTTGLGVLPSKVERLNAIPNYPVPHMGWNSLSNIQNDPLLDGVLADDNFYFVHSFAVMRSLATIATCNYIAPFSAILQHRNFWGVQFHPEKSGQCGEKILQNFLRL